MKKILMSTIAAVAITAAAIVPASAANVQNAYSCDVQSGCTVQRWCAPSSSTGCDQNWFCGDNSCPDSSCDGTTSQPGTGDNGCGGTTDLPEADDNGSTNQPGQEQNPDAGEQPDQEQPDQEENQGGSVSSLEQQVAALVNEQRAAYGLAALTLNTSLCDGARLKSQDMANNGYFSHESPTYGTPFAMMQSLGITYRSAGENIAMGYASAEAVMNAWMNSEGHRANILSSSYTQIGVGYVSNGNYWTQWFIS